MRADSKSVHGSRNIIAMDLGGARVIPCAFDSDHGTVLLNMSIWIAVSVIVSDWVLMKRAVVPQ